ncbi:MAG: hypothetical protein N2423_07560 [Novosphingobium sp.]|nr:hypothetical protein [Novosphingobium sp.]
MAVTIRWLKRKREFNQWRMQRKRRVLVLVDESARHPFRQSLPPHIRKQSVNSERETGWLRHRIGRWRGFLATYCAAFVVVAIFIA